MSHHTATIVWQRGDQDFLDRRYSRRHALRFDGGTEVVGSSGPEMVPVPMSDPAGVDPEELLVASLSSCHMLWFLAIAAKRGFRVDQYQDAVEGVLGRDDAGRTCMTVVTLRPEASWSGDTLPTRLEVEAMHHEAHQLCFIANSVRTEVRCEPQHGRE